MYQRASRRVTSASLSVSSSSQIPMLFLVLLVVLYFVCAVYTQAIAHASASCALLSHEHTFLLSCASIAVGAVVAGWLSDKIVGDRGLVLQLMLALGLAATLASSVVHQSDSLILLGIAAFAGILCGGSHVVVAFALELAQQQQLSSSQLKNSVKRVIIFSAFPLSILPVSLALEVVQNVPSAMSLVLGLSLMGVTSLAIFIARTAAASKLRELQENGTVGSGSEGGAGQGSGGDASLPVLFPDEMQHKANELFIEDDEDDDDQSEDEEGDDVEAAAQGDGVEDGEAAAASSGSTHASHPHPHSHAHGGRPRVSSLGNLTGHGSGTPAPHQHQHQHQQRRTGNSSSGSSSNKPSEKSLAKGTALVRTRDHKKFGGSASASTAAGGSSNAGKARPRQQQPQRQRSPAAAALADSRDAAIDVAPDAVGGGGVAVAAPGDAADDPDAVGPYCPACFPFLLAVFQRRSGVSGPYLGSTAFSPLPTHDPASASASVSASGGNTTPHFATCAGRCSYQLAMLARPLPFDNAADDKDTRRRSGSASGRSSRSSSRRRGNSRSRSSSRPRKPAHHEADEAAEDASQTSSHHPKLGLRALSRAASTRSTAAWLVLSFGLLALSRALLSLNFWVSPVEPLLSDDSQCRWRFPVANAKGAGAGVVEADDNSSNGGSSADSGGRGASIGIHTVIADCLAVVLAAYLSLKVGRLRAASSLALAALCMSLVCCFALPSLVSDDVAGLLSSTISSPLESASASIPVGRAILESLTHGLLTASMQALLLYAVEFSPSMLRGTVLGAAIGSFRAASLGSAVIVMMMASSSSSTTSANGSDSAGTPSAAAAHLAWTDYALQAPGGVGGLLVLMGFHTEEDEGRAQAFAAAASAVSLALASIFLLVAAVGIFRVPIDTKGRSLRTYEHGQLRLEKGAPPPPPQALLLLANSLSSGNDGASSSSLLAGRAGSGATLRGRGVNSASNATGSSKSGACGVGSSSRAEDDGDGDSSFAGCVRWIQHQTTSGAYSGKSGGPRVGVGSMRRGKASEDEFDEEDDQIDETAGLTRRGRSGGGANSSWFKGLGAKSTASGHRLVSTVEGSEEDQLTGVNDDDGTAVADPAAPSSSPSSDAWHIDSSSSAGKQQQQRYDYGYAVAASADAEQDGDDDQGIALRPLTRGKTSSAHGAVAITMDFSSASSSSPADVVSANPEADADLARLGDVLQRLTLEWEGNHRQKLSDALLPASEGDASSASSGSMSPQLTLERARAFLQRCGSSLMESRVLLRTSRRALQLHEAASDERYSRAFAHMLTSQGGGWSRGGPIDEGAKDRVDKVEALVGALQALRTQAEEAILAVSLQLKVAGNRGTAATN